MANSQLVLAAHYLAGLEAHRSLSSRGPQEGPGGVYSGKEGPYVTVGLDWELDQLPMPPTLKYKSRSISPLPWNLTFASTREDCSGLKHNLSTLCLVPIAWKTLS